MPIRSRFIQRRRHAAFLLLALSLVLVPSASAGNWPGAKGGEATGEAPELLLTFDDGPHEEHTKSILDTLDEHRYQGVFFWTGRRVTNERSRLDERLALVERAVRTGHLIGNHTSTHAKLCSVKELEAAQEIDDNRALFERLSGLPMLLFRVPYGARCKRLDAMLADRETQHMHWDLDPQEFRHHSTEVAVQYVTRRLSRLANGKRAILLMHDTQPVTAKALPLILEWIRKENARRAGALEAERDASPRKGRKPRAHKLPIRIITGSEFVEERYPVPLLGFARRGLREAAGAVRTAAMQIVPTP